MSRFVCVVGIRYIRKMRADKLERSRQEESFSLMKSIRIKTNPKGDIVVLCRASNYVCISGTRRIHNANMSMCQNEAGCRCSCRSGVYLFVEISESTALVTASKLSALYIGCSYSNHRQCLIENVAIYLSLPFNFDLFFNALLAQRLYISEVEGRVMKRNEHMDRLFYVLWNIYIYI